MKKLQKLIEKIVNEEISLLEDGPFGNVVFAPDRKDKVDKSEANTKIEDLVFDALMKHVNYNNSADLGKKFDYIYDLISSGFYRKEFSPPNGSAYRFLYGLSSNEATKILGLELSELEETKNKTFVLNKEITLNPVADTGIQSWAVDFTVSTFSDLVDFMGVENENVVFVIFETVVPDGGKFILNPDFLKNVEGFEGFEDENEIISKGPVKAYRTVGIYMNHKMFIDNPTKIINMLIDEM